MKTLIIDLFLNNFFLFAEMPVPDSASQGQQTVVERGGLIAAGLGDAAQAFGPTDGVFDLDAAASVEAVVGPLSIGQGRVGALFAAAGLAMGQTLGSRLVVGD
ncbi:hypothetical protein A0257_03200 [Hymenobacter psoromatis]|nr:hypothetical protein A0257_03200 [Hymenobacter psoromatis]